MTTYVTSPTKRKRRSKNDIRQLKSDLREIIEQEQPATVRQVFYRAVSAGLIDKTETEYKTTVCRLLAVMRRDGTLPYDWIADNTRWQRKPRTYNTLEEMLALTAETYRRAMWGNQDAYVEVWLEKEALAGVLYQVTAEWDVPLMVCKGYPSITFLHSAGEQINLITKPVFLYYFGDHDPSGVHIPEFVEQELRVYAPSAEINFERVAVTVDQIQEYGLQTRPTKVTDTRSKSFEGESVEVDAIPPSSLRTLAEQCIRQHIDWEALAGLERVEAAERATLQTIADNFAGADMKLPAELRPEDVTARIDNREQLPLCLDPLQVVTGTLATGDYSVVGLEDVVAIERKSLPDLLACIGTDRERFDREVQRLLAYPVRALVVESGWQALEAGEWRSQVTSSAAIGSCLGWIASGLPIVMAYDHERAGRFVSRILFTAARRRWREARELVAAITESCTEANS